MDIKVDFNPEIVAQKLQEAIVSSTFNTLFATKAKESVEKFFQGWSRDSMLDRIIDDVIREETRRLLMTEFLPQISELIRVGITPERLEKITNDVLENIRIGKERY